MQNVIVKESRRPSVLGVGLAFCLGETQSVTLYVCVCVRPDPTFLVQDGGATGCGVCVWCVLPRAASPIRSMMPSPRPLLFCLATHTPSSLPSHPPHHTHAQQQWLGFCRPAG